ncbi:phospholipase-like protein [Tanacetum coccineum]
MLRKQHKVDSSHYDMPLIYYTEGHSLHFGRPEFALITGLPFGDVNFGLYTSGELKFRNRVFPHKLGSSVTNLDLIGVIEDEETFQKLCDEDSIRLCLILCLENVIEKHSDEHFGMKKDPKYVPMYTLFGFVFAFQVWIFESFERCNCWWIKDQNLYQEHLVGRKSLSLKDLIVVTFLQSWRSHANVRIQVSEYHLVFARLISVVKKCLKDEVISELNVRVFKLETIIQVLAHERNEEYGQEEHVDIVLGKTNPTISWVKINKHRQNVNDTSLLDLLKKVKPWAEDLSRLFHSLDTVWLTHDIERFISQQGQVKCKFPWSDDYTVGRNFWLTLACLDHSRKGWLSEEILLQNSTPLFYANSDKYATPWSDVDQVFFPINETAQHWCLAHLDILSGLVTFYDSGDTYDYEWRDCLANSANSILVKDMMINLFEIDNERDFRVVRETYVTCQEFNVHYQERQEQMIEMQPFLHVSTVLADSYNLLKELQDYELEKCRELMKSISKTQLKERLPVILVGAKVFDKKGIDPTDYCIMFKLADNVPKQGGIFGDCGV